MDYNENIRERRKACGWTQQQLADELGVTRQMVTRWECSCTVKKQATENNR